VASIDASAAPVPLYSGYRTVDLILPCYTPLYEAWTGLQACPLYCPWSCTGPCTRATEWHLHFPCPCRPRGLHSYAVPGL